MMWKFVCVMGLIVGTYSTPVGELPLERLVANTQAYIDGHPNESRGYYILGRLYANAWARNETTFQYWTPGDANAPPSFLDAGASFDAAARIGGDTRDGDAAYFREAIENYGAAIQRINGKDANAEYWDRISYLGYAWLHEEGAKNPAVLGLPPFDGKTDSLTDVDREELRMALGAYDGNPNGAYGKRLFRDQDASLTVASAIKTTDSTYAGVLRFAKQAWILASVDYNEHVIAESPSPPGAATRLLSWLGLIQGTYTGYDQILSEACKGIIAVAVFDDKLAPQLKAKAARATARKNDNAALPRQVTPIILSLTKETAFDRLLAADTTVLFDLDGDGTVERWPWVAQDTALLVWIGDGTNRIDSGRDLIGSRTWWVFWKDGYEPLMFLDDDRDGWLRGAELDGLGLWFDRNGDGVADSGEVQPVTAHNIVGLNTRSDGRDAGTLMSSAGVEMADGTVLPTWDWEPMETKSKDRRTWP